jgi:hypothetical protein
MAMITAFFAKIAPWLIDTAIECTMAPIYKWLAVVGWFFFVAMLAYHIYSTNKPAK